MAGLHISATEQHLAGAREKIAFDKFHVARYRGEAVDNAIYSRLGGLSLYPHAVTWY